MDTTPPPSADEPPPTAPLSPPYAPPLEDGRRGRGDDRRDGRGRGYHSMVCIPVNAHHIKRTLHVQLCLKHVLPTT